MGIRGHFLSFFTVADFSDCTVDGNFQRKKTQNSAHIPDSAHITCFPFDPVLKYEQGSVPRNRFSKINPTFLTGI